MHVLTYKCPCCGAALAYSAESGKLECASCGNTYDPEALRKINEREDVADIAFALPQERFDAQEAGGMHAYVCESCGAELMTDGTTTATECAYCGSPAILPRQIEGGVRPEEVVPFVVTKEQAAKLFADYFQGKRLLPNIFLNTRNRIAEMRRLYVPYWLFDCDAHADMTYAAEKTKVRREGEWEIRRTEHYLVHRAGDLSFENIPVDGSEKLDDKISESLEPYDWKKTVPFQAAVLSGALADRADVDAQACEARAVERVEKSVEDVMRNTVTGYDSVEVRNRLIRSEGGKVTPVLLPVWLITTEKTVNGEKKVYTFAVNGQTGKLTCDVPYDKGKARAWFFGIFAGVSAVGYALLVLLNSLGVIG